VVVWWFSSQTANIGHTAKAGIETATQDQPGTLPVNPSEDATAEPVNIKVEMSSVADVTLTDDEHPWQPPEPPVENAHNQELPPPGDASLPAEVSLQETSPRSSLGEGTNAGYTPPIPTDPEPSRLPVSATCARDR
jgi:hypothetical protein